jgi:hypothetical protein
MRASGSLHLGPDARCAWPGQGPLCSKATAARAAIIIHGLMAGPITTIQVDACQLYGAGWSDDRSYPEESVGPENIPHAARRTVGLQATRDLHH